MLNRGRISGEYLRLKAGFTMNETHSIGQPRALPTSSLFCLLGLVLHQHLFVPLHNEVGRVKGRALLPESFKASLTPAFTGSTQFPSENCIGLRTRYRKEYSSLDKPHFKKGLKLRDGVFHALKYYVRLDDECVATV